MSSSSQDSYQDTKSIIYNETNQNKKTKKH